MYAIIADGGKQYMVKQGQKLFVETRPLADGADTVTFDQVLLVGEGETTKVGIPLVEGASVVAKLVGPIRGPKETIVKFRRRKGYRLKKGHRQNYLQVTIDTING